jgi:deoxyribodipyrimidine photo-lyase
MNELFTRHENRVSFPTDYDSTIERINSIDPLKYGKTRNFIDGAVTYLSPYISRGVISVKLLQQSVLAKGYPPHMAEKFLQELACASIFSACGKRKEIRYFKI